MSAIRIAVIGGGNMGRAIVEGGIRAGVVDAGGWLVVEPEAAKRREFTALGVRTIPSAAELRSQLGPQSQVMLAVKPQMLGDVARDAAGVDWNRVVISILAGVTSAKVRSALGSHAQARVIRVMPNTPARIGMGTTGVAIGAGARAEDAALALALFRGVGPVVEVVDESLMDAFTAVAGSGPAYLFYVAEAMMKAAQELGFAPDVADRIVRQTLAGASALLAEDGAAPPAELRAAVTSKGGTTAAATNSLDSSKVMEAFGKALRAARDRGRELGAG
jgi:pyrroline-5-carboxylate reductase